MSTRSTFQRHALAAGIVAASIVAPTANAQMLEEVIVTATKRAEGLQDVPIAISVMSGESVQELGMQSMYDVALYMPNVHVNQASAGDQLFIRGVGSGVNYGFEQSVGTFIDNVYYGRGRTAKSRFLDIERVEVLKGPQSTLFGKNTIAGAINITTKRPTDEFEGYVDARYRTELEGYALEGVVSGPLSDNVRARLTARYYEDDGYVNNPNPGEPNGGTREDSTVRLVVDVDLSDSLSLSIKAEHNESDDLGQVHMISDANPVATSLYKNFGTQDFTAGFDYQQYNLNFTQEYMDRYDLPWSPELGDTSDSDIFQATLDWQLGDHTLRSITAWTEYEFTRENDSDYSSLRFLNRGRTEGHEQFTQEFILSSPTGGTVEYLAGFFYQDETLFNDRHTIVSFAGIPPIERNVLALVDGLLGLPAGTLPPNALEGDARNTFDQDAQTWSVFTEFTFALSDRARLTAGIRYSEDEKEMRKTGRTLDLSGILTNTGNALGLPYNLFDVVYGPAGLNLASPHDYSFDRKEDHTTGNLNFQYDVSDATMVYANVSNGYKAGGFDEDNSLGRLDVAEFEDETVLAYELGAKIDLAGGRGRLNMALFRSDYDDVQVSTFDGNAAFVVGNAAETEVTGFEFDLQYALTDELTASVAGAWLDAKYKSFTDAACNVNQVVDGTCAANGGVQDLSGKPLQFAPEYTGNINLRYETDLTSSVELMVSGVYSYSDDVVVANDLDPNGIQDAYGKVDANITLRDSMGAWSVSLVGRNLTDEKTFPWMNDVPLGSFGFNKVYFKHIDPPRFFELQARINF